MPKSIRVLSFCKAASEPSTSKSEAYFLSEDYQTLLRLQNKWPNLQGLGSIFHETLKTHQTELLQLSHQLNLENQSDEYWSTALASRNSADTPFIKNIVSVYCSLQISQKAKESVVFIFDSMAVGETLKRQLEGLGLSVVLESTFLEKIKNFIFPTKLLLRAGYFLSRGLYYWLYVRGLKNKRMPAESLPERFVLRSWFTPGVMSSDGTYRDRNFGELLEYLKRAGKDVWVAPLFFNMGTKLKDQLSLISKSSTQFLLAEQYISVSSYFNALLSEKRSLSLKLSRAYFKGIDVSKIIREAHLKAAFSPAALEYGLFSELLKHLNLKKYKVDTFIYPFENNKMEKHLIIAVRRFFSAARVIGFQHSVWYKEQLGMFLLPEEQSYHPLPDRIVTSGKRYVGILIAAGFPETLISFGPNLRFSDIFITQSVVKVPSKVISIILNYNTNHAYELLKKACVVLKDYKNYEIQIKLHPDIKTSELVSFLKGIEFPEFILARGKVQEVVMQSALIIMGGGNVTNLEVIVLGVPLIRVSLDCNFDFDPLWDTGPLFPIAKDIPQLQMQIEIALKSAGPELKALKEFGTMILENYFQNTDQSKMQAFL